MKLSKDLVSQFVKLTRDKPTTKNETTAYATIVNTGTKEDPVLMAKIDGSDSYTPVTQTSEYGDGDRVLVRIKNHMATVIGNLDKPSTNSKTVETKISTELGKIDLSVYAKTEEVDTKISESISKITVDDLGIDLSVYAKTTDVDNTVKDINAKLELKIDPDNLISEFRAAADKITLNGNNFSLGEDGRIVMRYYDHNNDTYTDGVSFNCYGLDFYTMEPSSYSSKLGRTGFAVDLTSGYINANVGSTSEVLTLKVRGNNYTDFAPSGIGVKISEVPVDVFNAENKPYETASMTGSRCTIDGNQICITHRYKDLSGSYKVKEIDLVDLLKRMSFLIYAYHKDAWELLDNADNRKKAVLPSLWFE